MARSRRRRLGQNFLVDRGVADRIVEALAAQPSRVLEIGPGRGALTAGLLNRFDRVVALEMDEGLLPGLEERFPELELRHGDGLTEHVESLLGGVAPWQVAANLPYSVGTAILRRLLPRNECFSRLVVMLQREVVERLVARPGDKGHGLMALERSAYAEARVLFEVPPVAFSPRPRVHSAVVVVDLRPCPHDPEELRRAFALAGFALTRPRKMLANSLRPRVEAQAVVDAGLDPSSRPGELSLEQWLSLVGSVPSLG